MTIATDATPYETALAVLSAGTLTARRITEAANAALDSAADRLPVRRSSLTVTLSKRAQKTLGSCLYSSRFDGATGERRYVPTELVLSLPTAALNPVEVLADTIAHEVAHAVAGYEVDHGPAWKSVAREFGATPQACCSDPSTSRGWRFAYYCPGCSEVIGRQAGRPRRSRSCNACSSRCATVDLKEREVIVTLDVSAAAAATFRRVITETIEDYAEATAAVVSLNRTAR